MRIQQQKAKKMKRAAVPQWCHIESIVAHRTHRRTKTFEYKVRWAGYGPQGDTWEPVANLVEDGAVHYIERYRRMRALIKGLIQLCALTRRLCGLEVPHLERRKKKAEEL